MTDFVTKELGNHSLELNQENGQIRLSGSGWQTFFERDEVQKTLLFLLEHQDLYLESTDVSIVEQEAILMAVSELRDQRGRRPSRIEVLEHLRWSRKQWTKILSVYNPDEPQIPSATKVLTFEELLSKFPFELILGFTEQSALKHGGWYTFGVGGASRTGVTNTLFFYLGQALLTGATIWVCDAHIHKATSLSRLLGPLKKYIRLADGPEETYELFEAFQNEMNHRRHNGITGPTHLLFVDGWNSVYQAANDQGRATIRDTILTCEREMAAYGMAAILGVSTWDADAIGGTAFMRLLRSIVCHRMPVEESKAVLFNKHWEKRTPTLKTGQAVLRDDDGYVLLNIPLSSRDDAFTIKKLLENKGEGV